MQRPAPGRRSPVPAGLRHLLPNRRAAIALGLACASGLFVWRAAEDAEAARNRYGATAPVWVTTGEIGPGTTITDELVLREPRPSALSPRDAVAGDPRGRVTTVHLAAGEVVVASRLAGDGRSGVAALVPRGWRALAIATREAVPALEVGQTVEVLATFDRGTGVASPAVLVAARAIVVDVTEAAVTVAVPEDRATSVAAALVHGVVTLALVG